MSDRALPDALDALDALDTVIDYNLPFPNIMGRPLWLLPRPLDEDTRNAVVELHARRRAVARLDAYAAYTLGVVPAAHHVLMCEAIDDCLERDLCDDLVICIPPGGAKTTYASHAASARYLGRHPDRNVILATHTAELSEDISRRVRDTIATPSHAKLFPRSALSSDSRAVNKWATTAGGRFLAAGVGASILGFRADAAFIDDPVAGFEQAQSETQLKKIHGWFETDLITRLKPSGKIILVCQRLAPNDMAGYMIARNALNPTRRLKVLKLRMEAVPHDPHDPDTIDPLGRAPGERLWPEWFTGEMVEDAKRDEYKWRTLYQQEPPSSSGEWVGPSSIVVVEQSDVPPLDSMTSYVLTDLALSINKGDYSVHLVASVADDPQNTIYVTPVYRERSAIEVTVERHLDIIERYRPAESLIDDDNAAKVYVQLLATKARERGVPVPYKSLPMRGQDKETRSAPLRGLFRSGRIRIVRTPLTPWLVGELMMFPNAMGSGVDDGVDALGLIGRRLASLARPVPANVVPIVPKTINNATLDELWEDRERTSVNGNTWRRRI